MRNLIKKNMEYIMFTIVFIDIFFLIMYNFFHIPMILKKAIIYFDYCVCILILVEFIFRMKESENKLKFFKKHWYEIVAAVPVNLFLIRFLRLLGSLKIFNDTKMGRLAKKNKKFARLEEYIEHTRILLIAIIIIVFVASISLYIVDPGINTVLDGFWFVIATMTSVGYGDITPVTDKGKIIGIIVVICGFILLSILVGTISSIYLKKFSRPDEIIDSVKAQNKEINELKESINELKDDVNELKDIIKDLK